MAITANAPDARPPELRGADYCQGTVVVGRDQNLDRAVGQRLEPLELGHEPVQELGGKGLFQRNHIDVLAKNVAYGHVEYIQALPVRNGQIGQGIGPGFAADHLHVDFDVAGMGAVVREVAHAQDVAVELPGTDQLDDLHFSGIRPDFELPAVPAECLLKGLALQVAGEAVRGEAGPEQKPGLRPVRGQGLFCRQGGRQHARRSRSASIRDMAISVAVVASYRWLPIISHSVTNKNGIACPDAFAGLEKTGIHLQPVPRCVY